MECPCLEVCIPAIQPGTLPYRGERCAPVQFPETCLVERKKELDQQEGPLPISPGNFCVTFKDPARIPSSLPPFFYTPSQLPEQTTERTWKCARRKKGAKLPANTAQCSRWMRSFKPGAVVLQSTVSVKSPSAAVWTHAGGAERRGSGRADQLLQQKRLVYT